MSSKGIIISPQGRRPLLFLLADLTERGQRTARHPEFGAGVDQWLISKNEITDFGFRTTKGSRAFECLLRRYAASPKLIFGLERWTRQEVSGALASHRRSEHRLHALADRQLWTLLERQMTAYEITLRGVSIVRRLDDAGVALLLKKQKIAQAPNILAALCAPRQTTYLVREEIAFLRGLRATLTRRDIAAVTKKGFRVTAVYCARHIVIRDFIDRHVKRYHWVSKGYYDEPSRTASYYFRQIAELLDRRDGITARLKMLRSQPSLVLRRRTSLYRKLKIDKGTRDLLSIMQHAAFLKDVFREQVAIVVDMMVPILREVSRRRHVSITDLKTMSKNEVRECLLYKRHVGDRLLNERRHGYIMFPVGGMIRTWYGRQAERMSAQILSTTDEIKRSGFRGRIASAGTATGQARIVRRTADLPSFRKGEVLVVNNTTPDFVPVMRKASAIVAEEGGITAHVSVVTREMGIPCVVGIPRITFILKNGDLVEVDANSGTVRKL